MLLILLSVSFGFFFEALMIKYLPNKNNYDQLSFIIENLDNISESFGKYKKMNQTILGFIIITIIYMVLLFIIYFILGCESKNKNMFISFLIVLLMVFNLLNFILSCFIISKLLKIKKKYKNYKTDDFMLINEGIKQILNPIINIIYLLIINIILNLFELFAYNYCKYNTWKETGNYICDISKEYCCCCCCCDICESSSNNYSRPKTFSDKNNTINSNNKTITTITTENYIINLKKYVSIENYKYLKEYVEKGKKILIELIEFYKEMEFDGFKTKERISNEIISIIVIVAEYTKDKGDNIAKICLETKDDDAKWLLLYYLFPLIISVIKLKRNL